MEWRTSAALRSIMASRAALSAAICYVVIRFFFSQVFLLPVVFLAGAAAVAVLFVPCSVVLDPAAGTVTVRYARVVIRRLPLTQIERVESDSRLGFEFRIRNGAGLSVRPFRRRRGLERWLRIRTGFEGMESAISAAVAAARAAYPDPAGPVARQRAFWACVVCAAAGLLSLTAGLLVRPQVHGRLAHTLAEILSVWYEIGAAVALGAGVVLAVAAWREARPGR